MWLLIFWGLCFPPLPHACPVQEELFQFVGNCHVTAGIERGVRVTLGDWIRVTTKLFSFNQISPYLIVTLLFLRQPGTVTEAVLELVTRLLCSCAGIASNQSFTTLYLYWTSCKNTKNRFLAFAWFGLTFRLGHFKNKWETMKEERGQIKSL